MAWFSTKTGGVGNDKVLASDWNVMTAFILKYCLQYAAVTGTSQAMAVNYIYGANNGAQVEFTLPATAAVGDRVAVVGIGAGGWKIIQNASQYIRSGATVTTTGITGYVTGAIGETVELICVETTNGWIVVSSSGALSFT